MADWKDHLRRAIEHYGSQPKLARAIDCSQSKISWLLQVADQIDAETAVAIDRATADADEKGRVTRSQLRPDLWPELHDAPPTAPDDPERVRAAS
jgi:DNA-binding transcriptional regulator YdaS (Cro superfamily)